MGLYKIEGVVLRRRNLGEADRLVTVLSRDRGKLTVVARGARRPRSRLGGRLEPPTRFRALIAEGRSLDIISQVEVLDAHAALRDDLDRLGAASVVLELTDRALAERHPHPEVYILLLAALALVRAGRARLAWAWYAARLLVLTGHRPSSRRCIVCGARARGPVAWSAARGGIMHATCRGRDHEATDLTPGVAALIEFLLDAQPRAVARVSVSAAAVEAAAALLGRSAEASWEMSLRAPAVVGRLAASGRLRGVV